jgi:hypothetical protein
MMVGCKSALASLPLPLAGRGEGWGFHNGSIAFYSTLFPLIHTLCARRPPPPTPPRKGEGSKSAAASIADE